MFLWEPYSITCSAELRFWVSLNLPETLVSRSCITKVSRFMTRYPVSSLWGKRMKSKAPGKLWQSRFSWSEPPTEDKHCCSDHSSISFYFNMVPLCLPWLCLGKLFTFHLFSVAPLWRNWCFWFLHHADWGSAHTQEENIIGSWCKGDSTKHVSLAMAKDTPSRLGYKFNVSINSTDH